jgi:hypothetical protein
MPRHTVLPALLGAALLSASACTTTSVQTYRDPALAATKIEAVAILPLQNTRFDPQVAVNLNRGIVQAFAARNRSIRVIGPAEAQEALGAENLVEVYSQFLRDYSTSGLLNKGALNRIRTALNCDAILHGYIASVQQQDGYPYHPAYTKLTLTYSLIGLKDAVLLWNTSATVRTETTAFNKAPEIEEVIPTVQQTILASLPSLQ